MRSYDDADATLAGAAVIDELAPHPGDVVIDKFHYDAFFRTPLADVVTAQGCDGVVVTGVVTEGCVGDTVRGAFCHRIPVAVVRDAVAPYDEALNEPALRSIETTYGTVIEMSRAVADLESQADPLGWWE
jgi:isochorismate hydrolase